MKKLVKDIKTKYLKHETKKNVLLRFFGVLALLIAYFIYVSFRFGAGMGFFVTILTWSFFVFCTPIADAGFLIDFPVRLLTKLRMIYSEMIVWGIAVVINLIGIFSFPQIYQSTLLLKAFYMILTNPIPYWLIILLSAAGTFLSIFFGDELIDKVKHKDRKKYNKHKKKYKWIVLAFLFVGIILGYYLLIHHMGLSF